MGSDTKSSPPVRGKGEHGESSVNRFYHGRSNCECDMSKCGRRVHGCHQSILSKGNVTHQECYYTILSLRMMCL